MTQEEINEKILDLYKEKQQFLEKSNKNSFVLLGLFVTILILFALYTHIFIL